MTRSNCPAILLAIAMVTGFAAHAHKSTVYNALAGRATEFDKLAHDQLDDRYSVVDVDVRQVKWTSPKGLTGLGSPPPFFVEHHCVAGFALVLHVIALDGRLTDVHSVRATNSLLGSAAEKEMANRTFAPARMNDKPVPSVAFTRLVFRCPQP
jgi:hypothetical protein